MRKRVSDINHARSLLNASKETYEFTLTLSLSEASCDTIARNLYECFRQLGAALLLVKGVDFDDHIKPINELVALNIDVQRPLSLLDVFRKLRHNINYNGYRPSIKEVEDFLDFSNKCYETIFYYVEAKINS